MFIPERLALLPALLRDPCVPAVES